MKSLHEENQNYQVLLTSDERLYKYITRLKIMAYKKLIAYGYLIIIPSLIILSDLPPVFSEPCQQYQWLNGTDRSSINVNLKYQCDTNLSNSWYRFGGADENYVLRTNCSEISNLGVCGTISPGWMYGNHPQALKTVNRMVCFYFYDDCCFFKREIQVRNCRQFMIYRLPSTNHKLCSAYCTKVKDYCDPNPCYNHGTCSLRATGYTCSCLPRYTGEHCERNFDPCNANPCNQGICLTKGQGYQCLCKPGYTGKYCQDDLNECRTNKSICQGNCHNTVGSYFCSCQNGQILMADKISCFDPCQNAISLTDPTRSIYNDEPSSFHIKCDRTQFKNNFWYRFNGGRNSQMIAQGRVSMLKCGTISPGWLVGNHPAVTEGIATGKVCFTWGPSPCHWNRTINIKNCGNYFVYKLPPPPDCDLRYCTTRATINKCFFNPCRYGECINITGNHQCICRKGFTGADCAQDINECETLNGGCQEACINTFGSYRCQCANNSILMKDGHHCLDPCKKYRIISDNTRSFDFFNQSIKLKCDDNIIESVWYRFKSSHKDDLVVPTRCIPMFKCQTISTGWINGKYPTVNQGIVKRMACFNFHNSCCHTSNMIRIRNCHSYFVYNLSASKSCNPGTRYCTIKLDKCQPDPCIHGTCYRNNSSSFYCQCRHGYTGNICQTAINECLSNPCHHGKCINQENRYTCVCKKGITGVNCDRDINECLDRNGGCSHFCNNTYAGYFCSCPNSLTVGVDKHTCIDPCRAYSTLLNDTAEEISNPSIFQISSVISLCQLAHSKSKNDIKRWYKAKIDANCTAIAKSMTILQAGFHEFIQETDICYHFGLPTCSQKTEPFRMKVCSGYNVYQISSLSACYLNYCSQIKGKIAISRLIFPTYNEHTTCNSPDENSALGQLPSSAVPVRLVSGNGHSSGRVEVYHSGKWGTVCRDGFKINTAHVICKQLGFLSTNRVYTASGGTGEIWLDDLDCHGDELSIGACKHSGWGKHNCDHSEDVGISCERTLSSVPVRLISPKNCSIGRLEVYYSGSWGTVCKNQFDLKDANVVCKQLGFPKANNFHTSPGGSGKIWLDNIRCNGNEHSIAACKYHGWGINSCSHDDDIGVSCEPERSLSAVPVRLVSGNSDHKGRLEVYYSGRWGTVCNHDFSLDNAQVICRQLGFTNVQEVYTSGGGTGYIWLDRVNCNGDEFSIAACKHSGWGRHDCNHTKDVGISCESKITTVPVRLVSGGNSYGRVEIYYNNRWATVCGDHFGLAEAHVVCRQLGFLGASAVQNYGAGCGTIYLDDVNCTGVEPSLASCQHRGWGIHNCHHSADVGVNCTNNENYQNPTTSTTAYNPCSSGPCYNNGTCYNNNDSYACACQGNYDGYRCQYLASTTSAPTTSGTEGQVRLVDGNGYSSGRVEIYHNGVWGTVCDDSFNISNAIVICRQLGFSSAADYFCCAHYGRGNGTIWLDNVSCNGSESSISSCNHNSWGSRDCGHNEDVSVACINVTTVPVRLVSGGNSYGRVEIYYNNRWATVCGDHFGLAEAHVVCRQLGFLGASAVQNYGAEYGTIYLDDVNCTGVEPSLASCQHRGWGIHNCHHSADVGVNCTNNGSLIAFVPVRLAPGTNSSGRVEVYYNGRWGTVCDDYFDQNMNGANVVCRQLGFPGALSYRGQSRYGEKGPRVWLDDVRCDGSEGSIAACKHNFWGYEDCGNDEDVDVTCKPR
ncbi:Deleted in malignant brain tumors 1 protein [Trichoplax sp. H2]|nr:Deleted in malignant brain tumors 1 protein [Trichoplax sp. H2]|eukprot:RDD43408.1 Deleted in malignant brain tumors 1 protein [Trichoplax sp. H2]